MKTLALFIVLSSILAVSAFADTVNIVSDTTTQYYDDDLAAWQDSALAWVHGSWPSISGANWIWSSYYVEDPQYDELREFKKTFELPECSSYTGNIRITADNIFTMYMNGQKAGYDDNWQTVHNIDIGSFLNSGTNTFEFEVTNVGVLGYNAEQNPGAFIYSAEIECVQDFTEQSIAVPEFGTIAALVALAGAVTAFMVLRR